MPHDTAPGTPPTALIVGASRSLGRALSAELLDRGWDVIGTVRDMSHRTELHDLVEHYDGRLTLEELDVTDRAGTSALRERLAGRTLDLLFVNAGMTAHDNSTIAEVPDADFQQLMLTNALGPARVVETLADLVGPTGMIGAMSSGQGSITNNTRGSHEAYRASKAALNMLFRSYATRQPDGIRRALVPMAPGWIRPDVGGPDAPFSIDENIPKVVDVLLAERDRPGLEFLDHEGRTVPW